MGSNRSVYINTVHDDISSTAGGAKNQFQRDDFRSSWSHNNNGDGVATGKMITDITGNGFVYVDSHLASTVNPCFRYAYKDLNKRSDIRCSVALNTVIDDISRNTTAPYQGAGIIMQDAETGGIITFVLEGRPYNAPGPSDGFSILAVQKWTNSASFDNTGSGPTGNLFEGRIKATGPVSLAATRADSLTSLHYSLNGGITWNFFYSINHISLGTPYINTNRLGFGYYNKSGSSSLGHENAASFDWIDYKPST